MRILVLLVLAALAASPVDACNRTRYAPLLVAEFLKNPRGTKEWRGPFTASEVEDELPALLGTPSFDGVQEPCTASDTWTQLKQMTKPDDRFFRFSSSKESWEVWAGHSGYALVCEGTVIATIGTLIS